MRYRKSCEFESCDKTGVVSERNESVVRGPRMYRTLTDEYEAAALDSTWSTSRIEREKAEKRMDHIVKYEHYCPEHAEEIGIA